MNRKLVHVAAIAAVTLGLSQTASAAWYDIDGNWYAGLQVGQGDTHYSRSSIDGLTNGNVGSEQGTGGRILLGYQFNKYFATEFGYTQYPTAKVSSINGGTTEGRIHQHAIDLMAKAILPVPYDFNIYGLAGASRLRSQRGANIRAIGNNADADQFAFAWGGGVETELFKNWFVNAQFMRAEGHGRLERSDLTSVGVSYHFA